MPEVWISLSLSPQTRHPAKNAGKVIRKGNIYIEIHMYIYSMAKTIMVSNDCYEKLKEMKASRSFTETIFYLIESKEAKKKGNGLRACFGTIPSEDKEFDTLREELKPVYRKWSKRYA